MKSEKKILVPTNFSETAHNALRAALLFSTKQKVEILLVNFYHLPIAVDVMGQPVFFQEVSEDISYASKDKLDLLKKEINNTHPEINVHTLAIQGLMGDVLPSLCIEREIDIIVCGTEGGDWLEEHFTGTNTTFILGNISIPILVVSEKSSLKKLNKIVFATDFQFADVAVLSDLASFAKPFSADIEVVHMSVSPPKDQDAFDWMEEIGSQRVKYRAITYQNLISLKPTYHLLNEFLETQDADLLVMTTTGKNFFQRIFSGSLTWEMACHSNVPLLIYHIQDNKLN